MPHILTIDDNFNNRLLIKRLLLAEGFEVSEADNAPAGIELAQTNPPDLILMDIQMPEMDGVTATRTIRTLPEIAAIPVIALTANAMTGDREQYLDAGCDGYISKPIDIDSFINEITQYLG
ncbi:MAG: response regulator [Aggregatilineales bacterium]